MTLSIFHDYTAAMSRHIDRSRHMGWLELKFTDKDGNVTRTEQYGQDPLADKTAVKSQRGYWQSDENMSEPPQSSAEDEAGL